MKRMRVTANFRVEADEPKFKSYYQSENQPIKEVIDRWVNNNEQMYDERIHGYYHITDLLPYVWHEFSRDWSRRTPEEWDELKSQLSQGWEPDRPIFVTIYKNTGEVKLTEGNHRVGVLKELYEEDPETYEEIVSKIPVQFIFWYGSKEAKLRVEAQHPKDIEDAIYQAKDAFSPMPDWTEDDFDLQYLGELKVEDFYEYDDLSGWLEIGRGELEGLDPDALNAKYSEEMLTLEEYRGEEWAQKALNWIRNKDIPAIIIITAPDPDGGLHTQVGDGRGRINLANGFDIAIPAYHLIYKDDKSI
jgi:hypothetical protein